MSGADPIRVMAAVLWRDGRVLLGQRPAGGSDGGRWEFPGGKVQAGETDAAALARELLEELGIVASVGSLLGEARIEREAGPPIQLVFYAAAIRDGFPAPRHHQALRWVRPVELAAIDLLPADRDFARRLAALPGTPE